MAKPALNNCDADAYQWRSPSTIEWTSTEMIPIDAFSSDHADIYLMFNKDYEHSVDNSRIPSSIRIYVHLSRATTGPVDYPYYVWTEEPRIRLSNDGFQYMCFKIPNTRLYVLPVKKERHKVTYYSRGTNGAYKPMIASPEEQEHMIASPEKQEHMITSFEHQEPTILIGSCDGGTNQTVDDWC